ncbi:helix-turn-helix domain-containing protein [Bradyrhizobium sp. USDA 10063]
MEQFTAGERGFKQFCEATDEICDVRSAVTPDTFRNISTGTPLSGGLLIDARSTSVQYQRTVRHVARGGIDHYQIAMYLDGETEFAAGRRSAHLRTGDVCLIDMAQANRTHMKAGASGVSRVLTLVVPRARLAPLLATPDSMSASVVAADTPAGRLIGDHLLALRRGEARADDPAAVDDAARLVAGAVGSAGDAEATVARAANGALAAAIKRHIEAELDSPSLTAETLCKRFGVSRTQLYRLLEPDGGLYRYIRERRLDRAFRRLMSPLGEAVRLIDLAFESHFSSDNTFVRAFRHRFGITPGEVRELAMARAQNDSGRSGAGLNFDPAAAMRQLAADGRDKRSAWP